MKIGVPKEVKEGENRVAISINGAHALISAGHDVYMEKGAGVASSMPDAEYEKAGVTILDTPDEVWETGEMILKVKEPIAEEFHRMRPDHLLFTYLHLAACPELTKALEESKTTAVAYEMVTDSDGTFPLLAPMSQIAGRLSVQVGAYQLLAHNGGRGVLLSGVPGTSPGKVVVIGAGQVGASAAAMANGLRADTTVMDISAKALQRMDDLYLGRVRTVISNPATIAREIADADLVVGAVLVPGAKAPHVVTDEMVKAMKPGSVLVDVAIDQGGCFENSKPTTHAEPTFKVHNSLFYCVTNMPGAVANTATRALTNATFPYVVALADAGFDQAAEKLPGLKPALMSRNGEIVSDVIKRSRDD